MGGGGGGGGLSNVQVKNSPYWVLASVTLNSTVCPPISPFSSLNFNVSPSCLAVGRNVFVSKS